MLGAKLMKKATFDTDFETRTLELLKLRFVESELHHCDVMLRDMHASRRHLQVRELVLSLVHFLFWRALQELHWCCMIRSRADATCWCAAAICE
jgi:hypothetical protein